MGKRAHVEAARAAEHPFQREATVDNDLKEAIDYTLSMGRSLNEWRDAAIQKLRHVAEGFREAHAQLVRRVHHSIQRIVACINVPLFRHLLEEYEYDDPEAAEVCAGAAIVGDMDGLQEWPEQKLRFGGLLPKLCWVVK